MLKKMILLAAPLMLLFGCEKNSVKTDGNSEITDYNPSELFQTARAEQTALRSGFSFNAADSWSAWCTDDPELASADGKQWIKVVPASGKAGQNTIYVQFSQNNTKKLRRAYVNLKCGETYLTMTVEQEAESTGGEAVNFDIVNVFADTKTVYDAGVLRAYFPGCKLTVSEEKNGTVVVPDWIDVSLSERTITLQANDTRASRSAILELFNGDRFVWMTEIIQAPVRADGSYL